MHAGAGEGEILHMQGIQVLVKSFRGTGFPGGKPLLNAAFDGSDELPGGEPPDLCTGLFVQVRNQFCRSGEQRDGIRIPVFSA